ncbi:MAG: NUDIX domain-containing protein [Oscillospiraceae bacterium]|nr:NUDIX domain-containing protein [Oscillospiraceae bacterium]
MIDVIFCSADEVADDFLRFAVIIARHKNKFVFCRHKDRTTWEVPGGHRETGERIIDAAKRELYEESGAVEFELSPVAVYGVKDGSGVTYGMLFFADIKVLDDIPEEYEIAEIIISETMPEKLTYPEIQPKLWEFARKEMKID